MLARYLRTTQRPVRYAALDPAHEAAIRNYLSLMTRAQDLPGLTHELTRRQVIPPQVSQPLMQALRNPTHPADLAMGADMLHEAGLEGKIPTPGRAYRGFDAPSPNGRLIDQLLYHLHGIAQQGHAAMGDPRHPALRGLLNEELPEYSPEFYDRHRILRDASMSLGRILRALPTNHPLYSPIHALYMSGDARGQTAPGYHREQLVRGYDLAHDAELLGQQHGGRYSPTEDTLGDLDWTGRHARGEMAHGLNRLLDQLHGVRLARHARG